MSMERILKLAGLTEGTKCAVEDIKKGELKLPKGGETQDYAVVQDESGVVKVADETCVDNKDSVPPKPKKEGKLKLKEAFDALVVSKAASAEDKKPNH